jgi:SAM-dependent methyltransferase
MLGGRLANRNPPDRPRRGPSVRRVEPASLWSMDHEDHVDLIRAGVTGGGRRWLEIGAGEGAFTLALADLLGEGGSILATDREARPVRFAAGAVRRRFPDVQVEARALDYTDGIPYGPFDGILAANTLHFVQDRHATLRALRDSLVPAGRLVIVEYDADHGNPWVPHAFSFETWRREARLAGYEEPRLIGRVPSRFLGAIYASVADVSGGLLHSAPHGDDREE